MGQKQTRRILIFSLAYFPLVGGAEVAVREIAKRLPEYKFELLAARLRGGLAREELIDRVRVHRLGLGWSGDKFVYPILALWKALRIYHARPFVMTWAIMATAGLAALFFKYMRPSIPFLLTAQEGDLEEDIIRRFRFIMPLYKQIYRKADSVQAISTYLGERAKRLGFPGEPKVIPNGVDIAHFSQSPKKEVLESIRRKHIPDRETRVVFTASRLVKKNGIDILIRAVRSLNKRKKIVLLIAGTGKEEAMLRRLADDLGIRENVHFLGFIPHNELPAYYAVADVFARPSRQEGFGNVFVEAMAAGIPVIASTRGGIKDFLENDVTGVVCNPDNPESVANAIARIMDDSGLKERITANARRMVDERYDWDRVASAMKTLFKTISDTHA